MNDTIARVMVSLVRLTDEARLISVSAYDVDVVDVRWALPKQLNSWKQPGRATEYRSVQWKERPKIHCQVIIFYRIGYFVYFISTRLACPLLRQ